MSDNYDYINPAHYKNYSYEVIDMMERVYGTTAVVIHCELTAWKYRMRAGTKPDQPYERDLENEKWYLDRANTLREKVRKKKDIKVKP